MREHRSFGAYAGSASSPQNWLTSLAASSAIYVGIAVTAMTIGATAKKIIKEKATEISFTEKIVKESPPPMPAAPEVKPQAPAAAAPVVRPDQKIRRLEKPPPPKEMVAPKEMPKQAPAEADPSQDKGVAVYGEGGKGDAAGLEGGVTQGGTVGGMVGGAIALP